MKKSKKTFRFLAALWLVKLMIRVLRLMGRNATHVPGTYALKFCPDFLDRIDKPEVIIGVTGTNGKTTVCNLIADVLQDNGYDIVENRFGGNINTGIAAALIKNATLTGKMKKKYAVLEVDERMTTKIFPYVQPDILVVTNLFRDSYRRNAHTDFISGILNQTIPEKSCLLLNAEDLISNQLAPSNKRKYFGIRPKDLFRPSGKCIINDMAACPVCGAKLSYDYIRYNHIGMAHCPSCAFKSPEMDYAAESVDFEKRILTVGTADGRYELKLLGDNITDVYNSVTAFAALREFGVAPEKICASFKKMKIAATRFTEKDVAGKRIITDVAKGQNPIACSRICDFVRQEPGKKAVVLVIDDFFDRKDSSENVAWFFDTDFEFLNDDSIDHISIGGRRCIDIHLRLLMAGIPEEKIFCEDDDVRAGDHVQLDKIDSVYILHDLYTTEYAMQIQKDLCERLGGEK